MTHLSTLPLSVPRYHFTTRLNYSKLIVDLSIIIVFYLCSAQLVNRALQGRDILMVGGLVLGWYLISNVTALYNDFRTITFFNEIVSLLPNLAVQFGLITLFLFFFDDKNHARTFSFLYVCLLGLVVTLKMYLFRKVSHYRSLNGINQKKLIVLGETDKIKKFVDFLQANTQFGYMVVGTQSLPLGYPNPSEFKNVLLFLDNVHRIHAIDELIVISEHFDDTIAEEITKWTDSKGILLRFTPRFLQFNVSRFTLEQFGNQPLISVRSSLLDTEFYWFFKRLFDLATTILVLLIFGSFLLPFISLAILLETGGPIFIKQKFLGQGGIEFYYWEFRVKSNEKTTPIGKFLLETALYKFPHFFSVLAGHMSIVGPRAYKRSQNALLKLASSNYRVRYKVKPGLIDCTELYSTEKVAPFKQDWLHLRIQCDIWYIENWSPLLDFQIISKVVFTSIRKILFN